jgi:hypothetical protein
MIDPYAPEKRNALCKEIGKRPVNSQPLPEMIYPLRADEWIAPNLVTATVSCGITGNRPGGIFAAIDDRRNKAAVLIFANDLNLLLVAGKVIEGKGLSGSNRCIT